MTCCCAILAAQLAHRQTEGPATAKSAFLFLKKRLFHPRHAVLQSLSPPQPPCLPGRATWGAGFLDSQIICRRGGASAHACNNACKVEWCFPTNSAGIAVISRGGAYLSSWQLRGESLDPPQSYHNTSGHAPACNTDESRT